MHDKETELDHRAMYLLGTLVERATELVVREGMYPRVCGEVQTLSLSRAGYLVGIPYFFADGREEVRYEITAEGQAAWKAYRFI